MSDDLALTRLPQMLRDFRRDNPLVDFDLTVDQSGLLHQRLERDRLDVFIGKRPSGEERGQLVKRERLVWVGTPSTRLDLTRPLPLVVYPAPSMSRTEMRRALNRARLPFRSACLCRGVNGLIAAVAAGIGISAMAASLVPAQLTTLGAGHRLPELGHDRPGPAHQPAHRPAPGGQRPDLDGPGQRLPIAHRLPRRVAARRSAPRRRRRRRGDRR